MRTFILTFFVLSIINLVIQLVVMGVSPYPRTETRSLGRDVASCFERLFWIGWMTFLLFAL